ncbi:tachylectin-related carbohydrate-binding protein [Deinococcus oregonensis]|uniref:Tachylectin-related carbohydrate-binding protein n=1 Tax=Deinococcus oregonensis TaxID=1805970 RepID=A0ABV6AWG2_9DEIO
MKSLSAWSLTLLLISTAEAQRPSVPTTIYAIGYDGSLKWYRHNAALTGGGLNDAGAWDPRGGKEIGVGWNGLTRVFTSSGGISYGVSPNGDLRWYQHNAYLTGGGLNDAGAWNPRSGAVVGVGWNSFKQLFATSDGVIYAIKPNGSLLWYKHNAYRTGAGLETPGAWDPRGGKEVGVGWNSFTKVFAAPGGIIYGVMPNGDLRWYKHSGYLTGGGLNDAGAWNPRSGAVVGVGWNDFRQLFAAANGVIYGIKPNGSLLWYKHSAYRTGAGLETPGAWDSRGSKEIGVGWDFERVFGF